MSPTTAGSTALAQPSARHAADDGFDALDDCHRRMLAVVDSLVGLVAAIERNGGVGADERAAAAAIGDFFSAVARRHHEDEERHVFPALLASDDPSLVDTALRLQQDHGWLEEDWLEIEPQVQSLATGIGGCDIDTLRAGVEVFAALYRDHIELEESLAYPEARARLDNGARRAMGREMAARRRAQRRDEVGG